MFFSGSWKKNTTLGLYFVFVVWVISVIKKSIPKKIELLDLEQRWWDTIHSLPEWKVSKTWLFVGWKISCQQSYMSSSQTDSSKKKSFQETRVRRSSFWKLSNICDSRWTFKGKVCFQKKNVCLKKSNKIAAGLYRITYNMQYDSKPLFNNFQQEHTTKINFCNVKIEGEIHLNQNLRMFQFLTGFLFLSWRNSNEKFDKLALYEIWWHYKNDWKKALIV